jgi:threonine/homoserine/homoserine lactone efflux protein
MFGIHDYGLFLVTGLLLNLTPGQDTLYILGRTLAQGRPTGIAAALGISVGTALHCMAAALGLSTIVAASDTAFVLLKLIGAAYLVYLGWGLLRTRATALDETSRVPASDWRSAFRQGIVTNVTNPKVALFFLAFLPQFVDPHSPTKLAALLLLGITFVFTSTLWCLTLALAAGRLRSTLSSGAVPSQLLHRATGVLFIALGLRLALAER